MPSRAHASAKGVVLCGGEGARLRPLTFYFQKTILPVGSSQRPVLEFVLRLLRHHGIREVVLLVGYKHEQIMNYFGHGERLGVRLTYVLDDPGLRGTGGALLNAYRQGAVGDDDDTLLIYYADILSNIDLSDMLAHHWSKKAVATLAVSRGYRVPVGVAEVGPDGRIVRLREKPVLDILVSTGILALEAEGLRHLEELARARPDGIDIMGDLLPHLIEEGLRVEAYITDAFWYDMGSTEAYEKLRPEVVDEILGFLLEG